MSYKLIPTQKFRKQAKRLIKKFPSLKTDLAELEKTLLANPTAGTSLGNNAYKVRVSVKSKGKGKSGGMRVITFVITEDKEIYLLTIYDKSEMDSVDDKDLKVQINELRKKKE
ncbi:MAG TPA: type II toxin-antitoxin system RelE/ParE family toxin [Chitinophagales bacterium]|nr:type II toxin-antitoxin system RelE/ParE family toxin [Chitinophagales bacterium]